MKNSKKQQLTIFKKAYSITYISLTLGILFDYFFYDKLVGISFPLYILIIIIGLFGISYFSHKHINKEAKLLLIPLIFFSLMVSIRSSNLLTFLNIITSLFLLLVITDISFNNKISNFLIKDFIKVFFLPLKFITPFLKTLSDLFSSNKRKNNKKNLFKIIKGILIAIPILVIFIFLFSSSDLVFQKYLSEIVNIHIQPEVIVRIILVLITSIIFIGAYSYTFNRQKKDTNIQNQYKLTIDYIESSIILGSVNLLFLLFLLIQFSYLFGGEKNISSQGFTYAEYARRGFFELIIVATISLLLLIILDKYTIRKGKKNIRRFKILSTLLITQVILIMVSASTRLSLYEQAYGFTTLRLYSHAFIILLTVIFGLMIYKICKNAKENSFAFNIFFSVIIFLVIMNLLNPDAFIAKKNIERFKSTGRIDVNYLNSLSDDAIPVTIKMIDISKGDLKKSFAYELYWKTQDSSQFSNWQSFNISHRNAQRIINSKITELRKYKDYQPNQELIEYYQ